MRKALALCSYLPVPADRGDPLRVMMFLEHLSHRYELTVVSTGRRDSSEKDVEAFKALLPGVRVVVTGSPPELGNKFARWVRAILRRTPSWVLLREDHRIYGYLRSIGNRTFDQIFLLGDATALYANAARRIAPCHLDKSNILSVSVGQESSIEESARARLWLRLTWLLSKSFERRTVRCVDTLSVTSVEELYRAKRVFRRDDVAVVPTAVQIRSFRPPLDTSSNRVLWLGSLEYRPNVDGLRKFLSDGMPILAQNGYVLCIVGSGNDDSISSLARETPNVEMVGFVEDLESQSVLCRAGVIPLWSGAGVKLKTLTLMDLGLPVASTTVGMEGLPADCALCVSEDSCELATAIVSAESSTLTACRSDALDALRESASEERFASALDGVLARL